MLNPGRARVPMVVWPSGPRGRRRDGRAEAHDPRAREVVVKTLNGDDCGVDSLRACEGGDDPSLHPFLLSSIPSSLPPALLPSLPSSLPSSLTPSLLSFFAPFLLHSLPSLAHSLSLISVSNSTFSILSLFVALSLSI